MNKQDYLYKMIVYDAVPLEDAPEGLFLHDDILCFKSEYENNEGFIRAFIIESGEYFWGKHPQTIKHQRKHMVNPVELVFMF